MSYTVKQLADLAGLSVRTLHYYDKLGLFKPESRTDSGYRLYAESDLIMLQQILFFRELGFSLDDVKQIISQPDFDVIEALQSHRTLLQKKADRLGRLLMTVDKTIEEIKGGKKMPIKDYYNGFSDEQIESYRREVRERWGDAALKDSEDRVTKMGKEKFNALQAEGNAIFKAIGDHISDGPDSQVVQALVAKWRSWLENFSSYSDEAVLGLGRMYSQDPRFAAFFTKFHPDLPEFFTRAVEYYSANKKK